MTGILRQRMVNEGSADSAPIFGRTEVALQAFVESLRSEALLASPVNTLSQPVRLGVPSQKETPTMLKDWIARLKVRPIL